MMETWFRNNWPVALGGAGTLLAFIGTLLAAVRASLVGSITYVETADGTIVLVVVLLGGCFWLWRSFTTSMAPNWLCLLSAIIITGVSIFGLVDAQGRVADINENTIGFASVGAGPIIVATSGVMLIVSSMAAFFMSPARNKQKDMKQGQGSLASRDNAFDEEARQKHLTEVRELLNQGWRLEDAIQLAGNAPLPERMDEVRELLEQGWSLDDAIQSVRESTLPEQPLAGPTQEQSADQTESPPKGDPVPTTAPDDSETAETLHMLADLHKRGVLTDEEYAEYCRRELERL